MHKGGGIAPDLAMIRNESGPNREPGQSSDIVDSSNAKELKDIKHNGLLNKMSRE